MSFLTSTEKQLTALQIKSWADSATSSMVSAKNSFESIKTWLVTVQDNPEYTEEEKAEVIAMTTSLRNLALSLTE
jgi:ribulose 1,5-bisphosphate carboxylase large subunit-like protein